MAEMINTTESVFANLKMGDVVEIHAVGHKPRKVRVGSNNGSSVLVSSHMVRPGHIYGGLIAHQYNSTTLYYQPTLQQKARIVTGLVVLTSGS